MPTRDPAWPNHKVHPEERWGRVFLRSDSRRYGLRRREQKAGVKVFIEGRGVMGGLTDSAEYTFLVLTIPSC